ncbi:MAG: HPr family phosphocarrier protein [Alphaproteobacteria bacterium]|nr:HPr family phosphocarrier protein [Alphaproteobacteria bacterium]TAD91017.1 MAG: HPr family phosphocarrier protein [Alphaproteobacteria bacterium]
MDGVICRSARIVNKRGLHARAAAKFVKTVQRFDADLVVMLAGGDGNRGDERPCSDKDISVNGHSIMGLMMLAAGPGTLLDLSASGPDAAAALDAVIALIADRFEEDE